jgi:hypothetical protein
MSEGHLRVRDRKGIGKGGKGGKGGKEEGKGFGANFRCGITLHFS